MSEIQSSNQVKMEDPVETPDSSAEGTVAAIKKIHTSAEMRKPAEDSTNERRLSLSTQIATYSTKVALDAGVPDTFLRTKRKQGNDNASSISSEDDNDTTTYKGEDSLMLGHACTGLLQTSEVAQRKTRNERRDLREFSGPIDPEYARLLGSTTFSSNHGQDRSTHAAFSRSSGIRREDKDPFGPSNASEDVTNILSDWNRKYRRNDNEKLRFLGDSRDSTYTRILSSDTALAPVNVFFAPQQVSASEPDSQYLRILRQHEFSSHTPSPARDQICLDCNIRKPATQYPGYRQICNDCYAAKLSSEGFCQKTGKRSTRAFGRICGSCSEPKRGNVFKKVNGRSICSDCLANVRGSHQRTDQSSPDQPLSDDGNTTDNSVVLPTRKTRRRGHPRPHGFIDATDRLKSLHKPIASGETTLKRKSVQVEEATRLYEDVARRDQQARQKKQMMEPSNTKSPPRKCYSHSPVESNSQLNKLGVKTSPQGYPIWLAVSRTAPLGEIFVAALHSDDALRGFVFMLPGQFVRWDDTPDKLNLEDDECFEMHELPKAWLSDIKCMKNIGAAKALSVQETPEAEMSRSSKKLGFEGMLDYNPTWVRIPKEIVYDVKIPKPIDISKVASSISYPQYSSSSDSETSKFSLPKVSPKTEAELLAILAASKESTPSQGSVSESRQSPALKREPGIQNSNTLQNTRVSVSRSPSVIFLHESKGDVSSQEDAQLQDIKTTVKRLLSQCTSPEQGAKRLKRQDSQQDHIVLEDTD